MIPKVRTHCEWDGRVCVCPLRNRWNYPGDPPADIPCVHITAYDQRKPLAVLVARYLGKLSQWLVSGAPKRSEAGIAAARAACEACEYFQPDNKRGGGTCSKCGCGCGGSRPLLMNKWAWATERCPLTPPKWKEEARLRTGLVNRLRRIAMRFA